MYTSLSYIICIARVFDDHRSCQKLINYITNIKAKSKRYHWIQILPVLNRLFIQHFYKQMSKRKSRIPVFIKKKKKKKKIIMKIKNSPQVCK